MRVLREQGRSEGLNRFPRHMANMCLLVGLLALLEATVLWWMGTSYQPIESIRTAAVMRFSLSADGHWGASQVLIDRYGATERPTEIVILVHAMDEGGPTSRLDVGREDISRVTMSPSGDDIVYATPRGTVFVVSRHGNKTVPRRLGKFPGEMITDFAWGLDGTVVVAVGNRTVQLFAMPSGERILALEPGGNLLSAMIPADGARTLITVSQLEMVIWDCATGLSLRRMTLPHPCKAAAFTSDARRVMLTTTDGSLFAWSLDDQRVLWRYPRAKRRPWILSLSSDDSVLACVERMSGNNNDWPDRMIIRDTRTGGNLATFDPKVGHVAGARFLGNDVLYAWGDRGDIVAWDRHAGRETWRFSCIPWLTSAP